MEQPVPQSRFSPEVETVLRGAGWFPGRVVPDQQLEPLFAINWPYGGSWFQTRMSSKAWHILREFHGLSIMLDGPGLEKAKESFDFDPLAVRDFGRWNVNWCMSEWALESSVYPLGRIETYQSSFGVDFQGRIIEMEEVSLLGNTIDEAIENMILGRNWISLDEVALWSEASQVLPDLRKGIEESNRNNG